MLGCQEGASAFSLHRVIFVVPKLTSEEAKLTGSYLKFQFLSFEDNRLFSSMGLPASDYFFSLGI